jgi:hypothetical protein
MFIVKVNPSVSQTVTASTEETSSGGSAADEPWEAFKTPYTSSTPILADHSVVEFNTGDFILKAASGASMDDASKGIFKKPEWVGVDIPTFHEHFGGPYTRAWVDIYNNFITEYPMYTDKKKPRLTLFPERSTGGARTKRRKRKGKKTHRKRNLINRTRHNRQNHTRTWSSSR